MGEEVERLAEVMRTHDGVTRTGGGTWGCVCGHVLANERATADARHLNHVAGSIGRGWLAAHDVVMAARTLREAADDQESMLLDGMDGDFLLVDCGHIGHEGGRVGLSDVRPTDVSRWARDWLRARADRVAGGEGK